MTVTLTLSYSGYAMTGRPVEAAQGLTVEELASAAACTVRTVRYYIAEGLLPGPSARGKGASYGEDHLLRLRLIRLLVELRVPLSNIRQRLVGLSADETHALIDEETQRRTALARISEAPSPKTYIGALLERARAHRSPAASAVSASLRAPNLDPSTAPPLQQRESVPDGSPGSQTWRRQELAPGIELHVRSDVERDQPELIRNLLSVAAAHAARSRRTRQ